MKRMTTTPPSSPASSQSIVLSRRQVRRVDECAVHELHYPSIVLMENAGRNAAQWIAANLVQYGRRARVICGTGNNGGDGFVIARHLHNCGWSVEIYVVGAAQQMTPDAETNHIIARAIGLSITPLPDAEAAQHAFGKFNAADVVIDAMLGTGFAGDVREPMAAAIRALNAAERARVVAIDVPSGFDCDAGTTGNVAIAADHTITFVARKTGFAASGAERYVGEVVVADIGTPPELIDQVLAEEGG